MVPKYESGRFDLGRPPRLSPWGDDFIIIPDVPAGKHHFLPCGPAIPISSHRMGLIPLSSVPP